MRRVRDLWLDPPDCDPDRRRHFAGNGPRDVPRRRRDLGERAASFVEEARRAGAHTVELNLEPSHSASLFAERIYGPASRIVPDYVARLLTR